MPDEERVEGASEPRQAEEERGQQIERRVRVVPQDIDDDCCCASREIDTTPPDPRHPPPTNPNVKERRPHAKAARYRRSQPPRIVRACRRLWLGSVCRVRSGPVALSRAKSCSEPSEYRNNRHVAPLGSANRGSSHSEYQGCENQPSLHQPSYGDGPPAATHPQS